MKDINGNDIYIGDEVETIDFTLGQIISGKVVNIIANKYGEMATLQKANLAKISRFSHEIKKISAKQMNMFSLDSMVADLTNEINEELKKKSGYLPAVNNCKCKTCNRGCDSTQETKCWWCGNKL